MQNINFIVYFLTFIFGTIIGSFLNVVLCRYGTGRGLGGRSKCAITGKTLKWFELIPIVSFLIQGGRSRYSNTKISWQYPLVEFFTGLTFVFVVHKFLNLIFVKPDVFLINTLFYFSVFSILILIFVYDLRHKIIPDGFLLPLFSLSIVSLLFFSNHTCVGFSIPTLKEFLSGPVVAVPVFLLWFITRGRGMGFGDVLLLIPIGYLLGRSGGLASILLAFWVGALFGIASIIFAGKKMKSEIPFGPFLIIGFTLVFLYNIDMYSIANFFAKLI